MTDRQTAPAPILFRADSDAATGSGHLRRCLALAEQLRLWGRKSVFACRTSDHDFNHLVREAGFDLIELGDGDGEADAEQVSRALADFGPIAAIVVDNYRLGIAWERRMRPFAQRIVVIDDLADRVHHCDLLIDVAPGDDRRYDALVPPGCHKLLGPHYALLRPEFALLRTKMTARSGRVDRILISFGGVDADNLSAVAISSIHAEMPDVAIDVVLTSLSPHLEEMRLRAASDARLALHVDTDRMAELMASADLAIGAGGSTSWERACLGLPSLIVVIAENQQATAHALEAAGCGIALSAGAGLGGDLQQILGWLVARPPLLRLMGQAGAATLDGRGLSRVAAAISPPAITVRPAIADDARPVWQWRNAPDIRATAVDSNEIPWEDHRAWFARRLDDPQTVMLVGEEDGAGAGFLRFDLNDKTATVSIFLAPGQQGRGTGRALLRAGEAWVSEKHPDIARFRADVRPENGASIALFRGADYRPRIFSFERAVND